MRGSSAAAALLCLAAAPATGDMRTTSADGAFDIETSRRDPRIRVGGELESAFVVRLDLDATRGSDARGAGTLEGTLDRSRSRRASAAFEVARVFFLSGIDDAVVRDVPAGTLARATVVLDDVAEDLAHLVEVGSIGVEEAQRGLGVRENARERLIELVGDRCRELAHRRYA